MKYSLIALLILCSYFSSGNNVYAQNTDDLSADLNAWIDDQFTEGLDSFHIAGATILLMHGDSILHMKGYGLADIKSNTRVNGSSSIFGIGSVTKTFVAAAIMQLYEDGKLSLDRDVNSYLTSFQLAYPFNDSITVRHLLTHTAGLDLRSIGSAVREEKDVIPLSGYLKERLPIQIRPSGEVITYSNQSFALLGLIVEEVSGLTCDEYIRQRILKPLEMDYSSFKRQAELNENYVTGYEQKGSQLVPCQPDFKLDYPAGGLHATASDMGNFISMLLNNGNFKGTQILDSVTLAKIRHEPFRHYDKAHYGWLMGFQESYWKGWQVFGHGGSILGFESQLSLIPERNIGVFISTNSSNYQNSKSRVFIDKFIYEHLARLIPERITKEENLKDSPVAGSVDEPLEKFTGTYRYTFYGQKTLNKLGVLIGIAPEIEITQKDNTLEVSPYNGKLVPSSGLTFHSGDDNYVAFGKDANGAISHFFIEAYAYHKLKWYEPVQFQILWIGSILLISLIYILINIGRKLFVRNKKPHLIKSLNLSITSLVVLFLALLAFALMTTDPLEFFYGLPLLIKMALVLPFIIIPLELASIYFLAKAIRFKELGTFDLIYQSVIVVTALLFIPWLMYYNLIGFNY